MIFCQFRGCFRPGLIRNLNVIPHSQSAAGFCQPRRYSLVLNHVCLAANRSDAVQYRYSEMLRINF